MQKKTSDIHSIYISKSVVKRNTWALRSHETQQEDIKPVHKIKPQVITLNIYINKYNIKRIQVVTRLRNMDSPSCGAIATLYCTTGEPLKAS